MTGNPSKVGPLRVPTSVEQTWCTTSSDVLCSKISYIVSFLMIIYFYFYLQSFLWWICFWSFLGWCVLQFWGKILSKVAMLCTFYSSNWSKNFTSQYPFQRSSFWHYGLCSEGSSGQGVGFVKWFFIFIHHFMHANLFYIALLSIYCKLILTKEVVSLTLRKNETHIIVGVGNWKIPPLVSMWDRLSNVTCYFCV